jgi:hypothetical protein
MKALTLPRSLSREDKYVVFAREAGEIYTFTTQPCDTVLFAQGGAFSYLNQDNAEVLVFPPSSNGLLAAYLSVREEEPCLVYIFACDGAFAFLVR